jgi:hypothetical protein
VQFAVDVGVIGCQVGCLAEVSLEIVKLEALQALVLIDWIILVVYATSTIAVGWYFGARQRDTSDYFVGSGRMNLFLIGVSL